MLFCPDWESEAGIHQDRRQHPFSSFLLVHGDWDHLHVLLNTTLIHHPDDTVLLRQLNRGTWHAGGRRVRENTGKGGPGATTSVTFLGVQ